MFETIIKILYASWNVLLESSLFVLSGFFIAGMLKAFIPDNFIQRHLGKGKISSVIKASLFGVPIPLCSCGVIPAAAGLREQGASKGAVCSFMISTPESGVDSIAVTYALLDPFMTIMRPVAAFLTAAVAGIAVNILDDNQAHKQEIKIYEPANKSISSCSDGCCSGFVKTKIKNGFKDKFRRGMSFAFGELLGDIGPWLLAGIMLAGIITVYITPEFIESYLGDGIFSMIMMIALATPLYVCATASTPIAAALALKGLSPGAALVFLLAGPATNMATITVVSKLMGRKTTAIYLASIMGCSLIMGMVTNWLYGLLGLDITGWVQSNMNEEHGIISVLAGFILLLLVFRPFIAKITHIKGRKEHSNCDCHH
ncbi:MAG: SO_0444 family Cu/Zn efflux transporter [Desulfamplus sp.]|nr:SO_0444 family Cu/Zn efflux transporter [Desulfamplus sp.]MBF0412130.1 SO_0444 family Cu/Zn efflux transporter [Desulfamplus sp.]